MIHTGRIQPYFDCPIIRKLLNITPSHQYDGQKYECGNSKNNIFYTRLRKFTSVEKFGPSLLGSTSFAQPEIVSILVLIPVEYLIRIRKKPYRGFGVRIRVKRYEIESYWSVYKVA